MIANLTNSPCRLCAVTMWRLCCYRLKLCNGIPQGRLLSHANISFFSVFAVLSKLLLQTNGKSQLTLFWPKLLITTPYLFVNLSCSIQFHIIQTIFGLYDLYISTAWNIYINTSKLSVIEVDTKSTIHKLIGYFCIQQRKFPNSMAFEGRRAVVFGQYIINKL